jgi:hypothetical protein
LFSISNRHFSSTIFHINTRQSIVFPGWQQGFITTYYFVRRGKVVLAGAISDKALRPTFAWFHCENNVFYKLIK